MNNTLEILEVGMRDGLQNINTNLKIKDRIALVKGLISAGIKNIQLASFVNPKRIPQMACAEASKSNVDIIDAVIRLDSFICKLLMINSMSG